MLHELPTKNKPVTQIKTREIRAFDEFVQQGLSLRKNQTVTKLFEVTPELAIHILDKHQGVNRKLSNRHVENLKNAIRSGEWRVTAQGISINSEGRLDDGQHRMHAIIAAQRPVTVNVTVNADPAGFEVLDSGRKRTAGDVLGIDGYHDPNNVAASARVLLAINAGDYSKVFSSTEVLEFAETNEMLIETNRSAHRVRKALGTPVSGVSVAFFLIRKNTTYPGLFAGFVDRMCDGAELKSGSALLSLRTHLMIKGYAGTSGRVARLRMIGAIIRAWNAYVTGKGRKSVAHSDHFNLPKVK